MPAPSINVPIRYVFDDRSLRRVENSMRASARRLSESGNNLSLGLSLPMAAFAQSAISAAGDMESLRIAIQTTMQGAGRSVTEANAELERLRVLALAPGLDFEQAVKGSIRLQNVGLSAEKARNVLKELANAVAAGGGSAQELDGVTRQFAQMIAKGKVLNEDLMVISENMPGLARAMELAFGAKTAGQIQDMGISAEQFVEGITNQLAKMPRAAGGIKNALVNASTSVRQALGTLGEDIAKTFNITSLSDQFAKSVGDMVNWFKSLDGETKKTILTTAAYVAAVGPLIKVFSATKSLLAEGVSLWRSTLSGIEAAGRGAGNAAGAFSRMGAAAQATTVGLIAITAIVGALVWANDNLTVASRKVYDAQTSVNSAMLDGVTATSQERASLERNLSIYKDTSRSIEDRKKAFDTLKAAMPEYLKGLTFENSSYQQLRKSVDDYSASLIRSAQIQALRQKLIENEKKLFDAREEGKTLGFENASLTDKYLALTVNPVRLLKSVAEGEANSQLIENLTFQNQKLAESLEKLEQQQYGVSKAQRDAEIAQNSLYLSFNNNIRENVMLQKQQQEASKANEETAQKGGAAGTQGMKNLGTETEKTTKKVKDQFEELDKLVDKLLELNEAERKVNKGEAERAGFTRVTDSLAPQSILPAVGDTGGDIAAAMLKNADAAASWAEKMNELKGILKHLSPQVQLFAVQLKDMIKYQEASKESVKALIGSWNEIFAVAGINDAVKNSIVDLTNQGVVSFDKMGKAAIYSAVQVAKAQAVQGIFAATVSALQMVPFPLNIAAAAGAAALAGTLLNGLTARIKPPQLYTGAVVTGRTLAEVGEYSGAASNPEVIAPLSKLKQYLPGAGAGGGGVLMTEISGDKLQIILDRTAARKSRIG